MNLFTNQLTEPHNECCKTFNPEHDKIHSSSIQLEKKKKAAAANKYGKQFGHFLYLSQVHQ